MAQAVGLQFLLIAIGAILAAAIGMKNAAIGGLAKAHRHIQRPDRQILFHPVADRPAHDPATDRARATGTITTLTDKHDTAEQFNGPAMPPAMHESELHGLWLAKN